MANLKDLAIFCHKMEQMLHSGIDVRRSLEMLQDDKPGSLSKALERTSEGVAGGRPVHSAMRRDEAVYTPDLVNAVYIAEQTGHMDKAFGRMAERFDAQLKTQQQLRSAMIYPIIVLIVFCACLMAVAHVYHFTPLAGLVIAGIVVGLLMLIVVHQGGRELGQRSVSVGSLLIYMPVIGRNIKQAELADFASNMAVFYECGVAVEEGLRYCVSSIHYAVLRQQVTRATEWVKQGHPLSEALQMQGVFPSDLIFMLKTGEASGNVEGMLNKIAEYYRKEVENRTQILMAILRQ